MVNMRGKPVEGLLHHWHMECWHVGNRIHLRHCIGGKLRMWQNLLCEWRNVLCVKDVQKAFEEVQGSHNQPHPITTTWHPIPSHHDTSLYIRSRDITWNHIHHTTWQHITAPRQIHHRNPTNYHQHQTEMLRAGFPWFVFHLKLPPRSLVVPVSRPTSTEHGGGHRSWPT